MRACIAALIAIGAITFVFAIGVLLSFGHARGECNQKAGGRVVAFVTRRAQLALEKGELDEAQALAAAASDYMLDENMAPEWLTKTHKLTAGPMQVFNQAQHHRQNRARHE